MLIHTAKLAHYNLRYRTKARCLTAAYKANPKDRLPKVASANANDVIRSVWCILEVTLFGQPRSMVTIYQLPKENREISSTWLIRQILIIKKRRYTCESSSKMTSQEKKRNICQTWRPHLSVLMHNAFKSLNAFGEIIIFLQLTKRQIWTVTISGGFH